MPEPDLKTKAVIGLFLPNSHPLSLLWALTANSSYSLMGACFPLRVFCRPGHVLRDGLIPLRASLTNEAQDMFDKCPRVLTLGGLRLFAQLCPPH